MVFEYQMAHNIVPLWTDLKGLNKLSNVDTTTTVPAPERIPSTTSLLNGPLNKKEARSRKFGFLSVFCGCFGMQHSDSRSDLPSESDVSLQPPPGRSNFRRNSFLNRSRVRMRHALRQNVVRPSTVEQRLQKNEQLYKKIHEEVGPDSTHERDSTNSVVNGRPAKPPKPRVNEKNALNKFAEEIGGNGMVRPQWAEWSSVRRLGLAANLDRRLRSLQEARFEIISSEASYYNQLDFFIRHFYFNPAFEIDRSDSLIIPMDKHILFSNLLEVHITSQKFLVDLQCLLDKDPMLANVFFMVYFLAEKNGKAYFIYLANHAHQVRKFEELDKNEKFHNAIMNLQMDPLCRGLPFFSFLSLPMKRMAQLRLLVESTLKYVDEANPEYRMGLTAYWAVDRLMRRCQKEKLYMDNREHCMRLSSQLVYEPGKSESITQRNFVKEATLKVIKAQWPENSVKKNTLVSKVFTKNPEVTALLFDDLLIVAMPGEKDKLNVQLICHPDEVRVEPRQSMPHVEFYGEAYAPSAYPDGLPTAATPKNVVASSGDFGSLPRKIKSAFRFTVNSRQYCFMASSESEAERWLDALDPRRYPTSDNKQGLPLAITAQPYTAAQADENDLHTGDVFYVIACVTDLDAEEDSLSQQQETKQFMLQKHAKQAFEEYQKLQHSK